MKLFRISLVLAVCCFVSALSFASVNDDFEKSPGGLEYKFHRKSKSAKIPVESNVLFLNLSYSLRQAKKDSLLFDSRQVPQKILILQLQKPSFRGDIMEAMAMMEVGDSASFIIPADSFFLKSAGMQSLPPGIPKGASLIVNAGLTDIKTVEEMEALQKQADAAKEAEAEINKGMESSKMKAYLKDRNITEAPTQSGLVIVPVKPGTGPKPVKGQSVTVHYTGYLLNGTKFDSSVDRGQPFQFTIGEGQVIRGWDEGVGAMEVGSSFKLIIPSALGYGANGAGASIPPYSTLIFDVELIKAE